MTFNQVSAACSVQCCRYCAMRKVSYHLIPNHKVGLWWRFGHPHAPMGVTTKSDLRNVTTHKHHHAWLCYSAAATSSIGHTSG